MNIAVQFGPDFVENQGRQQEIANHPRLPALFADHLVDQVGDGQEAARASAPARVQKT